MLVGVPVEGGLNYLGRVGSGIAGKAGALLLEQLTSVAATEPPFVGEVPRTDAAGATWVQPVLVCEVQSLGVTPQGRLRQPSYRGLRVDLTVSDLAAENA